MPAGAPTKFTEELFDSICEEISTSERGLVSICKDNELKTNTFYDWIAKDVELSNKYARAKELQAEFMAEQILAIADETSNDTIKTEKGDIPNSEWIARSRLRVDSRKWLASKLYPKKYSEKVQQEITITSAPDIIIPGGEQDDN